LWAGLASGPLYVRVGDVVGSVAGEGNVRNVFPFEIVVIAGIFTRGRALKSTSKKGATNVIIGVGAA